MKKQVEQLVLSKIENAQDLVGSLLFTPRDIQENFFMPEGNIDHIELCEGENFLPATFRRSGKATFIGFGRHENIYYCAAGSYRCVFPLPACRLYFAP